MKTRLKQTCSLVALALVLLLSPAARAVDLCPGQVLVTDADLDAVFKVSLGTGQVDLVSTGQHLEQPTGIALGPANEIYVIEPHYWRIVPV